MTLPPATRHDARPPEVCVDFDGMAGCIAQSRGAAVAFLGLHVPHAGTIFRDDVLLVISELVTNAVRHAPGPLTLKLRLLPGAIGITVLDTSPSLPRSRTPDRTGGRGWPIVQSLARLVSAVSGPHGKTVHVELAW